MNLVLAVIIGSVLSPEPVAEPVSYTLTPRSRPDRTELHVSFHMALAPERRVRLELPQDCYGTPDLHRFVTEVVIERGMRIPDSVPRVLHVAPDSTGNLQVRYVLSFDPVELERSAFAPNTGPGHFHVAGCQWMLRPEDVRQARRYRIAVLGGPVPWFLYSSLAADPGQVDTVASHSDLIASAIGGSLTQPAEVLIAGNPVRVFVQGEYRAGRDQLHSSILTIIRTQRAWFRDHRQPFYTVTILPRADRLSGTSVPNLFVCFVGPDRSLDEILTLVAHETTHNWIPNQLPLRFPEGEAPRFQWVNEGVADYVGRKLLLSAGLMTEERFVELVNADLGGLASNPFTASTLSELIAVAKAGRTGGPFFRLPYNRGALLALGWDVRLTRGGEADGLQSLLRDLLSATAVWKGPLPEDSLFAIADRRGIDLREEFALHILNGEAIVPPAELLGGRYRLAAIELPIPFDPGFAVDRSARSGTIRGVQREGPADAAGLRNGMPVVRIENWNRFSPFWRPGQPITITTRRNGSDSTVQLTPPGNPTRLRLYRSPPR